MRVLIAEDNLISRSMLATVLAKWGYEVVTVADGHQAWDCLQAAHAPKLVVLDWMMPGLDGLEVCRRVRNHYTLEPPYLIMLTVMERKADLVRALEAGANDYITKPYDQDELRARVGVGRRVVELQEALARRVADLQDALAQIKRLHGIIPICMHCHKIRTDRESWQQIERYISEHSEAKFSHGICPECLAKHWPGVTC